MRWTESFEDFGQDPLFSDPSLRAYAPTLSRIDATNASDPLTEEIGKVQTHAACKQELKGLVQKYIPYSPGVYGILDSLNRLIYVGKSKALRSRLMSYFLPGATDEKAGQIIQ
ncbi:MAG: hypothetical protein ACKN9U_03840, partial [Pirellulaceae bacterium]